MVADKVTDREKLDMLTVEFERVCAERNGAWSRIQKLQEDKRVLEERLSKFERMLELFANSRAGKRAGASAVMLAEKLGLDKQLVEELRNG